MNRVSQLPAIEILANGMSLGGQHSQFLAGVRVMQCLSLPTLCELTLLSGSAASLDLQQLSAGKALRITVEDGALLFDGEITATHHQYGTAGRHETRIRAYDRLHRLRKRQRVQTFADMTVFEIATQLLDGLPITVADFSDELRWPRIVQWQESDLAFLTRIAARIGRRFYLHDGVLHFVALDNEADGVPLVFGESLRDVNIATNPESLCGRLAIHAWDPWHAAADDVHVDAPSYERNIEFGFDQSVGEIGQRLLADRVHQHANALASIAQAEFDRRAAATVQISGTAHGDAALRPGVNIALGGVAEAFEGRYGVGAATHTIDREQGYRTEIDTRLPDVVAEPHTTITTVGEVIDVDDPEGLARVRISLPTFDGIETDWLQVMTTGAGVGKGIIALPDVADRVLVLLPREDPAQAIVLGGLYGAVQPPDSGVQDGSIKRFTFVTPGGQRLCLDDEHNSIVMQTEAGNRVALTPGKVSLKDSRGSTMEMTRQHVRLHANCALDIEAPGNAIRIRGASVDFEDA